MKLGRIERYRGHAANEVSRRYVCAECHSRLRHTVDFDSGDSVLSCWDHPEHQGFVSVSHAERERLKMLAITEESRWNKYKALMAACRELYPELYEVAIAKVQANARLLHGSEEDGIL